MASANLILVFQSHAYSQKPAREFSYFDIYNFVDAHFFLEENIHLLIQRMFIGCSILSALEVGVSENVSF